MVPGLAQVQLQEGSPLALTVLFPEGSPYGAVLSTNRSVKAAIRRASPKRGC